MVYMKVAALKKKYKNKWILAKVLRETETHEVLEVEPMVVSSKRDDVYQKLAKLPKGSHVATYFTGPIPPRGTVFAFYGHSKI